MNLQWEAVIVDAHDPVALGRWWQRALGWEVVSESEADLELAPAAGAQPSLQFLAAPDDKVVKNRLHLDFRPVDRDAEVARLVALGARPVDIGQGEQSWVVLADPEGNEFCVLSSRAPARPLSSG
ncbi:MAG: VOC family protein [Acidimicrobiales bacterium]